MEKIPTFILALPSALLFWFLWQIIRLTWAPNARLPGPWHTKYTGAVKVYKIMNGSGAAWVNDLHRKYGRIVRLSPTEVDFSSVSALKTIHNYRKPFMKSDFYKIFDFIPDVSSVLSTRTPGTHGRFRRLLSGPTSESSVKLVEHIVQAKLDLTIQRMEEEMKAQGFVDVLKWHHFMATDVSGHLSFGESFQMLEQQKKNQYIRDLEATSHLAGVMQFIPWLFFASKKYGLPIFRESHAINARLYSYAEESLYRHKRMQAAEPQTFQPTFFTKLLQAGEKDGDTITFEEIIQNAQLFIIAGSDTTAHTLTYLVWQLSRTENRDIRQRLLTELATLPKDFANDDLKPLPYLNCVISETLRLHAAAPDGLPRAVPAGGAEVDGVFLPEGSVAITQPWSMHRDPEVFPDPERFQPSRWENPTKDMKDSFSAFGNGPRTCLGIHLAYMELRLGTAKFFLKFPESKIANGFEDKDMDMQVSFVMSPKSHKCLLELS
ncbi:unnamed protein product [Periconia digitata]|uniref:Cytochrome P450 n=1 Tax=Periconia digitata TaxID=1303443 RepID=A0A9W4UCP4_9PLEO|nr:unnamed protein product [Periconia digitata]